MAISKKLAAAAAAATLVFSFTAEAAPTLRVGSLTVYPPFEYLDSKTGQYEGFDMDLIREIGRRNDLDIRIVSMSLDLEKKTLCAEIGSSGALMMKRIPGTTIRTFNSAADAFLELNKGGCYAMLNDGPVNKYFLKQKASQSMNLVALDFVVSDDLYGMAVQKGNKKLLNLLDSTIDAMRADGSYQKIYDKWFGTEAK